MSKGYLAIESLGTTALLLSYAFRCSGVARWCGLHCAALAWCLLRAKIVFINSRENSDCKFRMCLRAVKTKHYGAYLSLARSAIKLGLIETCPLNSFPVTKT